MDLFASTVNHILGLLNIHTCLSSKKKDGTQDKQCQYVGCMDNKWGYCKAHFPCPIFQKTEVDPITGALILKKLEAMINTVAPVVTYLFQCNTDVASLRSGTAIEGVLSYCSDYIMKPGLKTNAIFEAIKGVIDRSTEMIGASIPRQEKAHKLMMKLVNNIGTKMELGGPMISMYLLGNPDHYMSHQFAPFYWTQFVQETLSAWQESGESAVKTVIIKKKNQIVGLSPIHDYKFHPKGLDNMNLYTWISRCRREKKSKKTSKIPSNALDGDTKK